MNHKKVFLRMVKFNWQYMLYGLLTCALWVLISCNKSENDEEVKNIPKMDKVSGKYKGHYYSGDFIWVLTGDTPPVRIDTTILDITSVFTVLYKKDSANAVYFNGNAYPLI
jgi:hypothetical protein